MSQKSVLITGASKGLGHVLVCYFLSQGWRVYALVRKADDAIKLEHLGAIVIISDVGDDAVKYDIQSIIKDELSVVINNAGVGGDGKQLLATSVDDFSNSMNVNCFGVLRVMQSVFPLLASDGLILNISSRFGSISRVASGEFDDINCSYSYHVAKAAQNMLTQCVSRAYKDTGVRVCAVHPGKIKTEFASADADKEPIEAAERIFALVDTAITGKFYSLFEGISEW
jgi:NAD(P)-dependent dehydrogenase (short-subunit alcohol dehydrogenase family)